MTMIERVARAISNGAYDALRVQGFSGGWDHDEFARDILTAIEQAGFVIVPREPTEGMLAAGMREIDVPTYGHVERCFTAMISSALSETSGGEG
jgi:hypothetical protein